MSRLYAFAVVCLLIISSAGRTQSLPVNPALLNNHWSAAWISCPGVAQRGYGIYHFRKSVELDVPPKQAIVHVSADNRYRFFVNGKEVSKGPARGDLYNWSFESVDIAPFLCKGKNTLAAMVWNMGEYAAVAQVSNQTGFLLQADNDSFKVFNTGTTWKVMKDEAYHPCSLDNGARMLTYMVIGPGDEVDAKLYPWGWEEVDFPDGAWANAHVVTQPSAVGYGTDNLWSLVPRPIPAMEEKMQRIGTVRRTENISVSSGFPDGTHKLIVPPHTQAGILFDQTFNTVAYPVLTTTGGAGASVKLTYAEALFKDGQKGNRNDIEGKQIIGNYDIFHPDGGDKRAFRPLWFRTFRYLQMDITTQDKPVTIEDLYGIYTGYPFVMKAEFTSSDPSLKDIWDVGWRTARLCGGENYFDCPYYEQLQYEGDTRIQSLISLYMTGDDRLMRKAIRDFYNSRVPEGLTQGRYPSNRLQVIPPFSLFWVSMLHDYWMYRPDEAFVRQYLTAACGVMDWYERNIDSVHGMLGPMKWWGFTDWNRAFPGGVPPGATDGNSAVITAQYIYTLRQASELFAYFGERETASKFSATADRLAKGTRSLCYDAGRHEMADNPLKNSFSQHATIIGVLSGAIPSDESAVAMKQVLTDTSLSQATFYYRFYLNLALKKAGMGDMYYSQLTPWRDMLKMGLTTFAENPDPTRSDCHAWSASPNYDFLATICGVEPASPGFRTVSIRPALGELTNASCVMPHPKGELRVKIERKGAAAVAAEIELPPTVTGTFYWKGKSVRLRSGAQKIVL